MRVRDECGAQGRRHFRAEDQGIGIESMSGQKVCGCRGGGRGKSPTGRGRRSSRRNKDSAPRKAAGIAHEARGNQARNRPVAERADAPAARPVIPKTRKSPAPCGCHAERHREGGSPDVCRRRPSRWRLHVTGTLGLDMRLDRFLTGRASPQVAFTPSPAHSMRTGQSRGRQRMKPNDRLRPARTCVFPRRSRHRQTVREARRRIYRVTARFPRASTLYERQGMCSSSQQARRSPGRAARGRRAPLDGRSIACATQVRA